MATPPVNPPKPAAGLMPTTGPEIDPAKESLAKAMRASFNILRVLMIVLVILYVASGFFVVQPGQQGLVARLGALREAPGQEGGLVFTPDWYLVWPEPFDHKLTITGEVQDLKITTFLFQHEQAGTAKDLSTIVGTSRELRPGVDGAMFTGDKNLSHGRWEIQYRIDDAAKFVQRVGDTPADIGPLLQRLAETAVVREVASRTVEEVTREALESVRNGVQRRLQGLLDDLNAGVTVVQVVAYTIEPGAVREAFMDVVKAENEKAALVGLGEERAREILNHAAGDMHSELLVLIREYGETQLRDEPQELLDDLLAHIDTKLAEAQSKEAGQVAVKLRDARAEANDINERLRREYEEFTKQLEQLRARPRITVVGLWADMRATILGSRENEIFWVPDSNEIEILVNRDVQRQRELEEQRTIQRQMRQYPQPQ